MAEAGHNPDRRPLIALDLARFACAMLVVIFHVSGFLGGSGGPAVGAGWVGVELFFVLSGVVIAWSAEGSTPSGFAVRRALRLVPAAWVCVSVTAAVLLVDGSITGREVGARWLAGMAFDPVSPPIDPSYWTLGIEVNFYVAVAVLLRGGAAIARIERFALMLGSASVAYWAATLFFDVPSVQNRLAQLTLLPHGCLFALGVLLRTRMRSGTSPVRHWAVAAFTAASGLEIVAHAREFPGGSPMVGWAIAIFAAGVVAIASADRSQATLERIVPARAAATLAGLTYPLYLIHQSVGRSAAGWLAAAGVSPEVARPATLGIVLALAWVVARHLEPATRRALVAAVSRYRAPAPGTRPSASPSAG